MSKEIDTNHHMIVFKGKNIRRVLHNDEWWFVVKDIIEALIDTSNSTDNGNMQAAKMILDRFIPARRDRVIK